MMEEQTWETAVNQNLVRRLQQRQFQPGVWDQRGASQIVRRHTRFGPDASLTNRLHRRWQPLDEGSIGQVPIVYAMPVASPSPDSQPIAPPPPVTNHLHHVTVQQAAPTLASSASPAGKAQTDANAPPPTQEKTSQKTAVLPTHSPSPPADTPLPLAADAPAPKAEEQELSNREPSSPLQEGKQPSPATAKTAALPTRATKAADQPDQPLTLSVLQAGEAADAKTQREPRGQTDQSKSSPTLSTSTAAQQAASETPPIVAARVSAASAQPEQSLTLSASQLNKAASNTDGQIRQEKALAPLAGSKARPIVQPASSEVKHLGERQPPQHRSLPLAHAMPNEQSGSQTQPKALPALPLVSSAPIAQERTAVFPSTQSLPLATPIAASAESETAVSPSRPSTPTHQPAATQPPSWMKKEAAKEHKTAVNMDILVNKVEQQLLQRLAIQRERRGRR